MSASEFPAGHSEPEPGIGASSSTMYSTIRTPPTLSTTVQVCVATNPSHVLFGVGGSQIRACQLTTTRTRWRPGPAGSGSTETSSCTSSKNRWVTVRYQSANSAVPRSFPSGKVISSPSGARYSSTDSSGSCRSKASYHSLTSARTRPSVTRSTVLVVVVISVSFSVLDDGAKRHRARLLGQRGGERLPHRQDLGQVRVKVLLALPLLDQQEAVRLVLVAEPGEAEAAGIRARGALDVRQGAQRLRLVLRLDPDVQGEREHRGTPCLAESEKRRSQSARRRLRRLTPASRQGSCTPSCAISPAVSA